jgi:diguanylate cyclase (GGDEF)-like protein
MIKWWPAITLNLQTQLTLRLMIIAALSAAISTMVFTIYELKTADQEDTLHLQSIADILAPNLTASLLFDDKDAANELIHPLNKQSNIVEVEVYDTHGATFVAQHNPTPNTAANKPQLKRISVDLSIDGSHYGKLVIYSDNSLLVEKIHFFISSVTVMLTATLVISFLVSLAVSRRFTTPISQLAQTAHEVTHSHNYALRAENHTQANEIGDLTRCFNSMLATIEHRDQTLELQVAKRTNQLKAANEQLKEQAYKDTLGGVPNRRYIVEQIEELISGEQSQPFTLMFIDLDGFKEVNDTMGHDAGDALVVSTANRIKHVIRQHDTLARLGGDEFTVLVSGVTELTTISRIAENIRVSIEMPFEIMAESISITASIGICCYPDSGSSVESIMKKADLAMYAAKEAGRNCFRFFKQPMLDKIQLKRAMVSDLREALANNELELYFQPIINIQNGEIEKAEALIRWNHPSKGLLLPDLFIPHAEENGLINEISTWLTDQAIHTVKRFRELYRSDFTVTVNTSPIQFHKDSPWFDHLMKQLNSAELGNDAIAIEITEHTLMKSDPQTLNRLATLNSFGVEIAIDDFGVGYSSLSYLQKLAVDIIKIDRSFVMELNKDMASNTLCNTMITMANNLNIKVVAEGVEEQEQLDLLAQFGCQYGQGYLFSKPIPLKQFEALLVLQTQAKSGSLTS